MYATPFTGGLVTAKFLMPIFSAYRKMLVEVNA